MANEVAKICLVIGSPVAHSLSPVMHNAAYKALGIDSQYTFLSALVAPAELSKFINKARTRKLHMLAVTIPHKEAIIECLDEVDNAAKEIGAVNTVLNKNGRLVGYNTDGPGAINALKQHTDLSGKIAVVLGSGGTAKAILHGLYKEKARLIVCSRNIQEAERLAAKYNCVAFPWEGIGNVADADIIINTTPIGRQGEKFPYIIENMEAKNRGKKAKQIVFDVNYNPANGIPLLLDAKKIGATVIDGLELLLQQGMLQFELYTGLKAPENIMRKTLLKTNHYENAS